MIGTQNFIPTPPSFRISPGGRNTEKHVTITITITTSILIIISPAAGILGVGISVWLLDIHPGVMNRGVAKTVREIERDGRPGSAS